MERLFLVSEVPTGYGQQVINSICQQLQPVIVLISNFENVTSLLQSHQNVTWVVVDLSKSKDWLGHFLRVIPAPNYIVNFSGTEFETAVLGGLRNCGHDYIQRERGKSELTFFGGLTKPADGVDCKVFINVVEKRSKLEKKSHGVTKAVGKLMKGASKTISNFVDDDSPDDGEENTPLIVPTPPVNVYPGISDPIGCIRSLLSCFCPCIFGPPDVQYRFQTPLELKMFLRSEQSQEIHKSLKKVHEKFSRELTNSLDEISKKQEEKLEELTAKVLSSKEEQRKKLGAVSDQQNKNTRDNLSNALTDDMINRIVQSRSRQDKGKVDFYGDRAFKEGNEMIRKQVVIDRQQLLDRHYNRLLEEQLRKLEDIQRKYQQKWESMSRRYFGHVNVV